MTIQAWHSIAVSEDRYKSGERLDVFVVRFWDLVCDMPISRGKISAAIKAQQIMLNDRKAKPHDKVAINDRVQIASTVFPQIAQIVPDGSVEFDVVFANSDFLIINKPAGLQVHPAIDVSERTLVHGLLALDAQIAQAGDDPMRPGIVHRLDRDTSGLMVVARTQEAFDKLKELFVTRDIVKKYMALVRGELQNEGEVNFPIARSSAGNRQAAVRGRIRYRGVLRVAKTSYQLLRKIKSVDSDGEEVIYSLASVQIHTGRTHQIRVHMRAIGHSVVGDKLYGPRKLADQFPHQFLHAKSLSFTFDNQNYTFTAPLPKYWGEILDTKNSN